MTTMKFDFYVCVIDTFIIVSSDMYILQIYTHQQLISLTSHLVSTVIIATIMIHSVGIDVSILLGDCYMCLFHLSQYKARISDRVMLGKSH